MILVLYDPKSILLITVDLVKTQPLILGQINLENYIHINISKWKASGLSVL